MSGFSDVQAAAQQALAEVDRLRRVEDEIGEAQACNRILRRLLADAKREIRERPTTTEIALDLARTKMNCASWRLAAKVGGCVAGAEFALLILAAWWILGGLS